MIILNGLGHGIIVMWLKNNGLSLIQEIIVVYLHLAVNILNGFCMITMPMEKLINGEETLFCSSRLIMRMRKRANLKHSIII